MSGRIPELPPSLSATVMVLAGLALVLGHSAPAAASRAATNAADDVRAKSKRLYNELLALQSERDATLAWINSSAHPANPAAVTQQVEEMTERIEGMRGAVQRVGLAGDFLARALNASGPHVQSLERVHPGWHENVSKARKVLGELRSEVERWDFDAKAAANKEELEGMLLRSLSEQGLGEWAANLPNDEEPIFDEADATPVHWDRSLGWVEDPR